MLRGTAMDGGGIKPAASDEAAIDITQLSEILGETDPALMREHLDMFLSHFPALLDRLDAAFAAKNDADIAMAAHTATGAAGMTAAVRLSGVLARIETAARAGDAAIVAALVPTVRSEYARVEAFVAASGLSEGSR